MSRQKDLFMVLDVETANDTDCPLVYDIGYAICDRYGNIYCYKSFLIYDVFLAEAKLMKTAYYANKIPKYIEDIGNGKIEIETFVGAMWRIRKVIKKFNIKAVCAYNASFDINALNNTLRYITKSKMRWFFPYGTEVNCIWHMACQVLYTQIRFFKFVDENDYFSPSGNIKTSAEIGWRYISKDTDFDEEHRGLQDVFIECAIMAKCYQQKKSMDKKINRTCWQIPTKFFRACFAE